MMKQLLTFIAAISFLSLAAQSPIKIRQIESSKLVVLMYDSTEHCWTAIMNTFEFEVIYKTPRYVWLSYGSFYKPIEGSIVRDWKSDDYVRLKVNDKYVSPDYAIDHELPDTCYYKITFVDSPKLERDIQDSLAGYICQIQKTHEYKDLGIYVLPIGTLKEFKAQHPNLADRLWKDLFIEFSVEARYGELKTPIKY